MKFQNKTILVTGGSMGIGQAIVQQFLLQGAKVIFFDKEQPKYQGEYFFRQVDVRDEAQIVKGLERIDQLDVLVNNAGVYYLRSVEMTTKQILDDVIDTNLKGYFFMCKHTLPLLKKSKGNIINISSALGTVPELDSPAYCSTKAAINMLTKCMAQEYASIPVRVNAVLPGPIDTPLLNAAFHSPEDREQLAAMNPMGRIGSPEDIAKVVLFLASDEDAGFITGGEFPVDGGESSSSLYSKRNAIGEN